MKTIRSESGVSRVGEFDGLLQGAVRQAQAANQPENGDYYDDEGFLVCGNCHTRRQVEVNMPDLKAVPFDPKKKVRVKMPVSCRCRAERRKQEEQMLMQDREMRAAQTLQRQSLMDERLRDISFDGFQQTKDNAYNLLLRNGSVRTFLESDLLFTVGIGEQRFDLLLICNALSLFAFLNADICNAVSQHAGKFRSILIFKVLPKRRGLVKRFTFPQLSRSCSISLVLSI